MKTTTILIPCNADENGKIMPDWELSARLLAKGNLPGGGLQCKSGTRESFVETCVYHGARGDDVERLFKKQDAAAKEDLRLLRDPALRGLLDIVELLKPVLVGHL